MYGTLKNDAGDSSPSPINAPVAGQPPAGNGSTTGEASEDRRSNSSTGRSRPKKRRIYSHCHIQAAPNGHADNRPPAVDTSARRRLIAASIICLVFMIAEVVGGVLSNSLAIATDAAHLLTDFASFMISLFALWLSSRPATRKMSFGWYRAEVIGALLSVLMIWLVTGLLVYMAIERLRTGEFEIDSLVMVITATGGLLVNIIMAIALNVDGHGHGHFHSHGHSHGHSHAHNHDHSHDIRNHSHHVHIGDEFDDEESPAQDHNRREAEEMGEDDDDYDETRDETGGDLTQSNSVSQTLTYDDPKRALDASLTAKSINGSHALLMPTKEPNMIKNKKHKKVVNGTKCNGASATANNGRGRSNINVRAAFVHVIGDFLQSLGVLIAALVIHFEPSYAIVDPICTFLFSIIVLVTTINIIKDATNVLMEGIPDGINFIEVRDKLQSLPNVVRVHNLRIWSLSLDKIAIATHLVIDTSRTTSSKALKQAIDTLKSSYNFFEVTIQIEEYREDMKDCEQCQDEDDDAVNMIETGVRTEPNDASRPAIA